MTVDQTASTRPGRPATGRRHNGTVRAMRVVLWLLAVAVFAQAVFAGLFLDGEAAWRDWHAVNGMLVLPLLALVQVVLAVLVWRLFGGKGHWPGAVGRLTLAASAWSGTPGAAQALPMAEGPSPSRGS